MSTKLPWHSPGKWLTVPAYWEKEIQDNISPKRQIKIVDCTLSEGEDMVGRHLSWMPRIKIAEMLHELNVGEITTPMGVSPRELNDFVKECKQRGITTPIGDKLVPVVVPIKGDEWKGKIDSHLECGADNLNVFAFYHMEDYVSDFSKHLSKAQVLDNIYEMVGYATSQSDHDIVFSFADSFRLKVETIKLFSKAGAEAGATGIYIYDSRGNSNPAASRLICREIKSVIGDKLLYVQHHNDLGMSTACSLAAAEGGADFIDAAMCGVGDRAGTAALEEVACALEVYGWDTGIKLDKLYEVAQYIQWAFDIKVQPWKPIIGWQANKEEGWGHRDPGDPPEVTMGISGEVIGRPFESVIGTNVFGKIQYNQPPGVHKRVGFLEDLLEDLKYDYGPDDLQEINNRVIDALLSRRGCINQSEFKEICDGVFQGQPRRKK